MTARLTLQEVADYLRAHDNYLLLSHRRPDGDTVGSCAALCRALRAMGKQAWVYANPQFTPKFMPYLDGLTLRPEQFSIFNSQFSIVACDIASRGLFPFGMEDAEVALAIDHHGTNDGFAARTHADETKAACGELLVDLLPLLGGVIALCSVLTAAGGHHEGQRCCAEYLESLHLIFLFIRFNMF